MNAVAAFPAPGSSAVTHALHTKRIRTEVRPLAAPTLWVTIDPDSASGLQNFTPSLVTEFQDVLDGLVADSSGIEGALQGIEPYTVLQSSHDDYFSLGGDLRFFRRCIAYRDAARLRDYSMRCLNVMYAWATRLKASNTSIALVQGRALGGGFEVVLGADYVIAEKQSTFGFPEIMFGLFPCTGAMGLLSHRIGARRAERMMTNRRIYSALELFDLGLIDEICEEGEGEAAVERFIASHCQRQKAMFKVQQSRQRHSLLDYEEGVHIVDDWVETAMNLSADELRSLEMLVLLQEPKGKEPRGERAA